MEFKLAFGKGTLDLSIEDHRIADVLEPANIPGGRSSGDIIKEALAKPMGTPPLIDIVHPGDRIAVVTSDITRPCPSRELLPPVLEELRLAGAREEDITVIFALGSHRQHTEEEKIKLVGDEIFHRFRCIDHDPLDCIHLGTTKGHSRGNLPTGRGGREKNLPGKHRIPLLRRLQRRGKSDLPGSINKGRHPG